MEVLIDLTKDDAVPVDDFDSDAVIDLTTVVPAKAGTKRRRNESSSAGAPSPTPTATPDAITEPVPAPKAPTKEELSDMLRSSMECAICSDNFADKATKELSLSTTRCGHMFHAVCIKKALGIKKVCPLCNAKANPSDVHPVFL